MRVGKVLRPPAFGARLRALDSAAAEAIPGVQVVREGDGSGLVGVVAPDELTAERALLALRAQWDEPPSREGAGTAPPTSEDVFEYFRTHPAEEPVPERFRAGVQQAAGSVPEGLAGSALTLRERYTAAYIAHAPLEPRAAVAEWDGGGALTVWTGTQRPFGVRRELAEQLGLPEERVRVIVPDTGSGYGGKHYGDAAIEAARLARAAGCPVRLVWTREEEFTWAYFRPAALIEIGSGAGPDGALLAWEHHTYNAGSAGIRTPYAVPHQHVESHVTRTPLRQGSYRALAATANTFARESHLDELAARLGIDPLEMRRRNLPDGRLLAVLEGAAERFGWVPGARGRGPGEGGPAPALGRGLAGGTEKGSYVGVCAEVAVDLERKEISVRRVVVAFECGAVVNPEHLANQVEGATVQGLGGALLEAISFGAGRVRNPSFGTYRVPRFSDTPELEVVLLERQDLPSAGGGETPIIGIAPAVGNAVYDAVGIRLRDLPLRLPS
jgi:isoquinoline 1-oxidoreductase